MKKHLVEIITDVVVIILPLDILYLYFGGGWCEPIKIILWAELIMLFAFPVFGIWRVYSYIKGIRSTVVEEV